MYSDNLKKQVPMNILDPLYQDLYNAIGSEIDLYNSSILDTQNQFFVNTAVWGLSSWEKFLGISLDSTLTDIERRGRVLAKLLGQKVITKNVLKQICANYGYDNVNIDDISTPNTLNFDFSYVKMHMNADKMFKDISNLIPAHLGLHYNFLTFTWADILAEGLTYDGISFKTYNDFSPEQTSTLRTPVLKLDLWEDANSFCYLDFNANWSIIDSRFSNHNHDGNNSPKITISSIAEDVDSNLNTIDSLTGSDATRGSLRAMIANSGYNDLQNINNYLATQKKAVVDAIKSVTNNSTLTYSSSLAEIASQIWTVQHIWGAATATPNDVVINKTYYDSTDYRYGSMAVWELPSVVHPSNVDQVWQNSVICNYNATTQDKHNAGIMVALDTINPADVVTGKTIFGVTGTAPAAPKYKQGDIIQAKNLKYDSATNSYIILA